MSIAQVAEQVRKDPKVSPILQAAVREEEAHAADETWLGWTWYQVQAHPSTLMKLVISGIIRVNFKSNSQTCYLLSDRGAVKQVLSG